MKRNEKKWKDKKWKEKKRKESERSGESGRGEEGEERKVCRWEESEGPRVAVRPLAFDDEILEDAEETSGPPTRPE